MARGPSPNSNSPRSALTSPFTTTYISNTTLTSTAIPPSTMAVDSVSSVSATTFGLNAMADRRMRDSQSNFFQLSPLDTSSNFAEDPTASVLIRRLPRDTNLDVVRTLLLFSKDVPQVQFVDNTTHEDQGFITALARFRSITDASEAKERLDGKAVYGSSLVVDLLNVPVGRRNTVDGNATRSGIGGASNGVRQSSRFNGTFKNMERMSPPNGLDGLPAPESGNAIQNLFSPQSPLANSNTSKSIINDDPTDETGKLLSDAVGFPKSGEVPQMGMGRRPTAPQLPISRFAGLSLSTSHQSNGLSSPSGLVSPRSFGQSQTPNPTMSPNGLNSLPGLGPNSSYPLGSQQFHRHNYPPVNPADQNPPCNTLYVGNLPMDTSEDELKAIFSKQRGYKRLCFRTKANGPMCFVEFEDTSFATKALNELYGQPLHNSVKGGIRLSFSKNPLGVRSGQNTSSHGSMSPHGSMTGMTSPVGPNGFSTATGPPPGLPAPGGFSPVGLNGNHGLGLYGSNGFGINGSAFGGSVHQPLTNGHSHHNHSNGSFHPIGNYDGYDGRRR